MFDKFAARYAARGLFVFPVFSVENGQCKCSKGTDCKSPGKHPIVKGGKDEATTDPSQVELWASLYPDANIGIATGPSGLVVLDVDPRHNGIASLKQLGEVIGDDLKSAWKAKTGSGGYHYYFKAREDVEIRNSAGKLGEGLDIRGEGGYVLAPPSQHVCGGFYKWERKDKDEALPTVVVPQALIDMLNSAKAASPSVTLDGVIGEGGRNDAMFRIAASLRAKGLSEDALYAAISIENQQHCAPPLEDDEVRNIVASVCKYEQGDVWNRFLEWQQKKEERKAQRGSGSGEGYKERQKRERYENLASDDKGRKIFPLTRYTDIRKENVDWLMPGYLAIGKFSLGWGLEGRGKSYLSLGVSAMISRGEALPGIELPMGCEPGDVLLLTYEDDSSDTIKPRLEYCGADMSHIFTVNTRDAVVTSQDLDVLEHTIEQIPNLKLLVIDPLTSFCSGIDEISESAVREAFEPVTRLAARKKFALLGIKHANKNEKANIANRTAGSRAWTALARCVFLAGLDNEKVQERFHTYGGLISTKGNLSGVMPPLTYEIDNGKFKFTGTDESMTPERLFPKATDEKKKGS